MSTLRLADFADKLTAIMDAVASEFTKQQTNALHKGKINLPQFLVMYHLLLKKESNMKELSRIINLTGAATTGIVDRLVGSKYVARSFDPCDRRVIKVHLTEKGRVLILRIYEERKKVIMHLFQKVSESDQREYLRILNQIKDGLKKETNSA